MSDQENSNKISSEDTLLSLDNILSYKIAPGDIFWVKKNKTKVRLRKAGDPIDKNYFQKFEKVQCGFVISEMSRINFINDGVAILTHLLDSEFEKEKWLHRNHFINWLKRNYMHENSKASQLELMLIGMKVFLKLPPEIDEKLIDYSIEDYRRSAIAGIVAVSFALSLGYLDFKLLQDLYHLFFLQDMSFVESGGNFVFSEALEQERKKSGDAIECLKKYGRNGEFLRLIQHPFESVDLLNKSKKKLLHNGELFELIRLHHEKLDGSGFGQFNGDELGDFEQIYVFVNYLVAYKDPDYSFEDGHSFLTTFLNIDGRNNLELRLITNIKNAFEKTIEQKEEDVA